MIEDAEAEISRSEMLDNRKWAGILATVDKNQDGRITLEEFRGAIREFIDSAY